MRLILVICLALTVWIDGLEAIEPLNCDESTLEEERAHSTSCEILMDALYDLEMSGSDLALGNTLDRTSRLQNQRHREAKRSIARRDRILRRRKRQESMTTTMPTTLDSIGTPNNPPFFPGPNMTAYENQVRLQVCRGLLQLPGTRSRCCTTLWVTCPEYGPNGTATEETWGPPPPAPPPPAPAPLPPPPPASAGGPSGFFSWPDANDGESIFESSSGGEHTSSAQSVLTGIANSLMGALSNLLSSGQSQQPSDGRSK